MGTTVTLEFHYIKQGRAFGPVDARDFLTKLAEGVIDDGDLVRVEGGLAWSPAYDVAARLRAGMLQPVHYSSTPARRAAGAKTVFTSAPPAQEAKRRTSEPPMPQVVEAAVAPEPPGRRPRLKKCTHCGARTAKDAAYCHRCGGDQSLWTCDGCLAKVERGAKFCGHCGKAL